jgi:hypothetical protein
MNYCGKIISLKPLVFFFLSFIVTSSSCGEHLEQDTGKEGNHLVNESSPYLLQHAYNPVDWYPWGEEAFEKARKEDKPLIISIGYAACHWCHVMEHESFEDSTVADYMNEHFVAIKVDREERPDVDQIYMNAAQLISGRGGWPLNAFALPNGQPFYAATYFPKEDWMKLLKKVHELYTDKRGEVEESASKITEGIRESELITLEEEDKVFTVDQVEEYLNYYDQRFDREKGGFEGAPKFPLPVAWEYVLQSAHLTNDQNALQALETTLDKMATGGIYDQIGGGFARYSVDSRWFVPHFEKMLYDNGQLISLYACAYQASSKPLYKEIVQETINFAIRELGQKEGGFYSSLDADSEGEEGKYYIWSAQELQTVLSTDEYEIAKKYYGISEEGNWEEDKNILTRQLSQDIKGDYAISKSEFDSVINQMEDKLFTERAKRVRPGTDDKVLASWNALMCNGLTDAYRVFGNTDYLERAKENAEFVLSKMSKDDGGLYRNYKKGKASIPAFMDDYAYWIEALLNLYEATFDLKWLEEAERLSNYAIKHFADAKTKMFYYTADQKDELIARKMEVSDNVTPASNSVMACNLYLIGHYLDKKDWIDRSRQMLLNVSDQLKEGGPYYAKWASLHAWMAYGHYDVAIVGEQAVEKYRKMEDKYHPNVFYLGSKEESSLPLLQDKYQEGRTVIYVCQNKVCKFPVEKVGKARGLIEFNQ